MLYKVKSVNTPFWILTILVFIALLLPKMIQEGMFMDGMLYACVSKNLANGFGSFWFPRFSQLGFAGIETFHEHPPLVFGIQALFFKIFGNSLYTEKIFSLFTACVTAWLIVRSWKLIHKDNPEYSKLSWLPVLFWIIMPIVYFSFQNNLMENTMGIFILMAFYFALRVLILKEQVWLNLILSGVAIFLASFSKGVPGLFPIGIVGFWWLIKRTISFKQMIMYTLVLILVPAVIYFLLVFFNENAFESLSNYTIKRLYHRIQNAHTVGNRFHVLEKIVVETLPSIILTVVFLFAGSFKKFKNSIGKHYLLTILFVFIIGLSGTIPLMLTLVQKSFYFIHALPFFGLGLAMLSAPILSKWINRINLKNTAFRIFHITTVLGLLAVLTFSFLQIGKTERDQELLHDVHMLGENIQDGSLISVDREMHNDWALHCYMIRYNNISSDSRISSKHQFMLVRQALPEPDSNIYKRKEIPLKMHSLYEIKK